jgi:hypothetical protein
MSCLPKVRHPLNDAIPSREGSTQGPFDVRSDAERGLESHLRIFKDLQLSIDNTGFYSSAPNLALVPVQMQWR